MARTYTVKRAQQRYETKPVLNEDGTQKTTPKMKNGVQMKSKSGRPVVMKVTERDLTRPLPMPKCGKCGTEIAVGQPYKYTEAYNQTIIRCAACPAPHQWEYSSSLSARLAEIEYNATNALGDALTADDFTAARDELVEAVRELASEKEDSASNMEDGFGHETEQSSNLREIAEQLESWADEIEAVEIPDEPEPEEEDCPECEGQGKVQPDPWEQVTDTRDLDDCPQCGGTGEIVPEEPTEDQMAEWAEQVRDAIQEVLGSCPV